MGKKPVLVVMAAGMGSRYGGLKQIDPVGSHNEAILDYSLFDAYEAGFETAVLIIKEAIAKDFMDTVGARLAASPMEIRYAYQEISCLPEGYAVPAERSKPWGTAHAVLCAKDAIDGAPFAVINADDYYGKSGFRTIFNTLSSMEDDEMYRFTMVGYHLCNTVTENGYVSRGVCGVDEQGNLASIVERTRIEQFPDGIKFSEDNGQTWEALDDHTLVSMNLWGFTPGFLDELVARFPKFLDKALVSNPAKAEWYLPFVVEQLLTEGKATVAVKESADKWYGVTYQEDKPQVIAAIANMTRQGMYPDPLWAGGAN